MDQTGPQERGFVVAVVKTTTHTVLTEALDEHAALIEALADINNGTAPAPVVRVTTTVRAPGDKS